MGARTIGIDTGGTFTDLVEARGDELRVAKLPSTPEDPGRGVLAGLGLLGGAREGDHLVHGTTVALNALLTGSTAPVALVTGKGFADVVEIARQERPDIYALHPQRTPSLVPRERRFEVDERIWPALGGDQAGTFVEVARASEAELEELRRRIARSGAESIAVCLLHAWADPRIEERLGRALAPLGLPITLSAAVLPEHREVERFSTAVVNAALAPCMRAYLGTLGERVAPARLSLLQSSGGTLAAERAALEPVRVILSGPAGGVVGAAQAAREAGFRRFVALDMGGTSTDVAFHRAADGPAGGRADAEESGEREATRATEPVRIAGHPVGVPSLDIHTIGCGGGSLVTVDAGGILHVGPESAGAVPGPVAYGQSDAPTVTDAHVLLGHVAEGPFLSGGLPLRPDRVQAAFEVLSRRLGGVTPLGAAVGVLEVARAAMRRAIGVMTMQRGQDPERLPLVAFGGAGGLHAAALAELLGMPAALVPLHPGALSARGMTSAEALRDQARTVLAPLAEWPRRRRREVQLELARRGRDDLVAQGAAARAIQLEHSLDLRYRGQSFEIRVAEGQAPEEAFHRAHARLYGHRLDDRVVELVCLRTRALVPRAVATPRAARARPLPATAVLDRRPAVFERSLRRRRALVVDRACLRPGHTFEGPALVEEYSGTTLVPPGWRASVRPGGHLLLGRSR